MPESICLTHLKQISWNRGKRGCNMPGIWRFIYITTLHRAPCCISWCVSGCRRAGHDSQCEGWLWLNAERVMSPVRACFISTLGGRTDESHKDVGICYGYKAGGTTSVKEIIVWLKRLWTGCMRWAVQLLHACTLMRRLKTKPGSPCILKLSNLPWSPCYPQRLLTGPVALHNCSTSILSFVSDSSLIAILTT